MLVAPILFMKAWQLIEDPKHWTQGAFVRDSDGYETELSNPNATCWCAMGAIRHCYPTNWIRMQRKLELAINNIAHWNDHRTHAEVLAKLKELDI